MKILFPKYSPNLSTYVLSIIDPTYLLLTALRNSLKSQTNVTDQTTTLPIIPQTPKLPTIVCTCGISADIEIIAALIPIVLPIFLGLYISEILSLKLQLLEPLFLTLFVLPPLTDSLYILIQT